MWTHVEGVGEPEAEGKVWTDQKSKKQYFIFNIKYIDYSLLEDI